MDFIFYPFVKSDDAIIIELKVNHAAEDAIQQIKDRQYALRFEGRCAPVAHVLAPTEAKRRQFGENPQYTGRILAVGMAYNKEDANKRHQCVVEVLRERIY